MESFVWLRKLSPVPLSFLGLVCRVHLPRWRVCCDYLDQTQMLLQGDSTLTDTWPGSIKLLSQEPELS